MTTTPLATIADALIDFILSLLRDPAAAEEFDTDPEGTMDRAGLSGCSVADVRQVAPVIYDQPEVVARATQPYAPVTPTRPHIDPVERAISNIVNNFTVDNRATVVDQSVNQNIWAEGDVNQLFDQEAVVNTGDNGAAAGEDALVDNSTTDVEGDVNVGNTTTDTTVTDSFNDNSETTTTETDTTVTDSFNDGSTDTSTDTAVDASLDDDSDDSAAADGSFDDSSDGSTEIVVADSDDVQVPVVDSPPEDPFVDDQP